MGRVQWFEPPRHALVLFVVLAVLPAAALAWMSWQLLAQDRALESQRLQERLERAADLVAAALDRRLAEAADRLPALNDAGEDVVVVTCLPRGLETHPPGRLPYLPVVPVAEAAPARLFEAGEALEFRQHDHAGAAAAFEALARSAERPIRAAALVRLGRVLRKAGRHGEALEVYDELARLDPTSVGAVPAELLARQARLSVLEALGRTEDVREQARALEYTPEPVSVAELAETVVAEFAEERTADADRIRLDIEESMPEVRADREALGRALWNLLDNAVKYSPRGALVRVEAARDGAGVAIRVRDEGPGIEPGEQQRIFGKFVRGEASRASNVKGTGIGLAMVRHIVRAHGGEVRLASRPGEGSTFSIVLPAEGHAP